MRRAIILTILIASITQAKIITIIDNGIERKIAIATAPDGVSARMVEKRQKSIIIAFKKGVNVDIESFSQKYKIKLEKKLSSINYYIFSNKSQLSDIELIAKISKENKHSIKSIRPNWGFNNRPR